MSIEATPYVFFSSCSSLRFASNAHTHPSHSTHTLHGARAQIHSMCHGISFSQTSTNINSIIINYSTPSWFPSTKCNSDQKSLQNEKIVSNKMACPTLQKYNLVTKFPDRNKSAISDHKHPQKSSCFQQTSTNILVFLTKCEFPIPSLQNGLPNP